MTKLSHIWLTPAILILISFIIFGETSAQAEPQRLDSGIVFAPEGALFIDITLTEEGVTAFDEDGNEWFYDFEEESFVLGAGPSGEGRRESAAYRDDLADLPIDERAVVRREVEPFDLESVVIGVDEYVDGDVVAFGAVTVRGWVRGNAKSLKRVLITSTGYVDGDVEAPRVVVKQGGHVGGALLEDSLPLEIRRILPGFNSAFLTVILSVTVFLLFTAFVTYALFSRQLAVFRECQRRYRIRTTSLGFLMILFCWLIIPLPALTIVGIVLVPFIPVLYLAAIALGIISAGLSTGGFLLKRYPDSGAKNIISGLLGIVLLALPWLAAASMFGSANMLDHGLGIAALVISILVTIYPVMSGVGAAVLTRFGFKEYMPLGKYRHRPARSGAIPAPPPIPNAPPFGDSSPPDAETS